MYNKYWKVTDAFPVNSVGIVTARDRLTIQHTPDEVWGIVRNFSSLPEEQARESFNLGQDVQDWRVSLAQEDLKATGLKKELIVPILYRPFDVRYTYYTGRSRGFICRPRPEVMYHMMNENLGLLVHKRKELPVPYSHFFVTDTLSEHCCVSIKTTNYHLPLYLYENNQKKTNVNYVLANQMKKIYGTKPEAKEILHYVYAIFYSNIYRSKYAEFLETDFPRVPFTTNHNLFIKMGKLGKKLVELHLLKSELLSHPIVKFQGKAENVVEKPVYNEKESKVHINKTQYFEGVEQAVWEYRIGGYQVLSKWLKDRKGRKLSLEDIKHYCKVVTALKKTIEIQEEIDKLYPSVEKDVIPFKEKKVSIEKYTK